MKKLYGLIFIIIVTLAWIFGLTGCAPSRDNFLIQECYNAALCQHQRKDGLPCTLQDNLCEYISKDKYQKKSRTDLLIFCKQKSGTYDFSSQDHCRTWFNQK